jgi:hypothetical protein
VAETGRIASQTFGLDQRRTPREFRSRVAIAAPVGIFPNILRSAGAALSRSSPAVFGSDLDGSTYTNGLKD